MFKKMFLSRQLQILWISLLIMGCSRISKLWVKDKFKPEMVRIIRGTVQGLIGADSLRGDTELEVVIRTQQNEYFTVIVGPIWYLSKVNMYFRVGEEITVIGSIVDPNMGVVIAQEIKRGRMIFVLRDRVGRSRWDTWYSFGDEETMPATAQRGYTLHELTGTPGHKSAVPRFPPRF